MARSGQLPKAMNAFLSGHTALIGYAENSCAVYDPQGFGKALANPRRAFMPVSKRR